MAKTGTMAWAVALGLSALAGCDQVWGPFIQRMPPAVDLSLATDMAARMTAPDLGCPVYPMDQIGGLNRPEVLVPGGMYSIKGAMGVPVPFMVPDFYLDVFEVTVRGYRDFYTSTGMLASNKPVIPVHNDPLCNWSDSPGSKEDHPVNCVTWDQANRFCQWAGRRLPTEEEWEYAAAGPGHSTYPWGIGEPMPGEQACWDHYSMDVMMNPLGTCPEGSYDKTLLGAPNCHGVADLAGNVYEWTSSEFNDPFVHPVTMCITTTRCSIRGGSWTNLPGTPYLQDTFRGSDFPNEGAITYGFRCASTKK